jgi:hypothetical protein
MKRSWWLMPALVLATGACDPSARVVLNERIFVMPEMVRAGGGCMTFELRRDVWYGIGGGGGNSGGSSGSSGPDSIVITEQSADDRVLIRVSVGPTVLAERRYDEAFLRSERVDVFEVEAPNGARRLMRFWGSFDDDGQPECAPDDDLGVR